MKSIPAMNKRAATPSGYAQNSSRSNGTASVSSSLSNRKVTPSGYSQASSGPASGTSINSKFGPSTASRSSGSGYGATVDSGDGYSKK